MTRKTNRILSLAAAVITTGMVGSPLRAQDDDKPIVLGGFENTGSVSLGYRFTSVSGYRPEYQQLFGLNSGPRVLDFSLFGHLSAEKKSFADDYSIVASGIGGEPWSTVQINVRKKKLYDLRVNLRQSHYYWNQNDGILPNGAAGLTSNHDWATVRRIGSANLLIHATNNLRFSLEYSHNDRHGVNDTTRTMDYFGAPPQFTSYALDNPYYLVGLIDQTSNRAAIGVDYTLRAFSFHYNIGMERLVDSFDGVNPYPNQVSNNPTDPLSPLEPLKSATWADYRKLTTPVSEFSYSGKIFSRLKTRGSYIFHTYTGPATLAMGAAGSQGFFSPSTIAPYSISETSASSLTETSHVADQGLTLDVAGWLSMEANYRYSRFEVNSNASFSSVQSGVTTTLADGLVRTGTSVNQWLIGTSVFDYDLILNPAPSLMVRAGVRYLKNDIEFSGDGKIDPLVTRRIKTVWPTLSMNFKPSQAFSIRAEVDELSNGSSYTQLTPHTNVGSRVTARYRPIEKLWIEDIATTRDSKLTIVDFHSRVRSNSTTATYDLNERFSTFVGFSYDSFWAKSTISFLPGLSLYKDVTLTDQSVDRLWQAGFRAVPVKNVTVSFAGNYVRVNGQGIVLGSTPLYGPMTFPYASGSLTYDAKKAGKLTVQLQRTYYIEQIVPGNNFGAKILLISWTRSF